MTVSAVRAIISLIVTTLKLLGGADAMMPDRLIQHYWPNFHRVMSGILRLIAEPRETPLADEFISKACSRPVADRFTLLSRLKEREYGDEIDIEAECLDHMAAGIDTTGDALCFLMWELSQESSFRYQKMLQTELRSYPQEAAEGLPILDAIVHEGLRCFPAIPMSLPRYVPTGGRIIDNYFIPQGTIVSCQAYSVHRQDETVFPKPDCFDPERWLSEKGDADRKRLLFAFSSGGRGCVGKQYVTLKFLLFSCRCANF